MEDDLTRAQHYRNLAAQMRASAQDESNLARRNELFDLARQYDRLAEKLIGGSRMKHYGPLADS